MGDINIKMDKEQLKQLLKESLSIDIEEESSYGTTSVEIKIKFDGEEICSDYYCLSKCLD